MRYAAGHDTGQRFRTANGPFQGKRTADNDQNTFHPMSARRQVVGTIWTGVSWNGRIDASVRPIPLHFTTKCHTQPYGVSYKVFEVYAAQAH